jgi:inorganic phosphate transporter, PiT family
VTTAVAKNVATGLIDANLATMQTLLAALFGAIAWNLLIRTLGQRVFRMDPEAGFAAQAAAGTIYLATRLGYPLSTTHVVSGAVMGSGATKRLSAVRWGVAGNIVLAWVLTLPAAAAVAAAFYWPIQGVF